MSFWKLSSLHEAVVMNRSPSYHASLRMYMPSMVPNNRTSPTFWTEPISSVICSGSLPIFQATHW